MVLVQDDYEFLKNRYNVFHCPQDDNVGTRNCRTIFCQAARSSHGALLSGGPIVIQYVVAAHGDSVWESGPCRARLHHSLLIIRLISILV
jgi:hypothetical protein